MPRRRSPNGQAWFIKGTTITRGTATAVVTETGMKTAVGEIAHALASTEETRTPLQEELDELGRTLGVGVVLLSVVVAPVLVVRGTEAVQAALTAVSLAVAAVPEGLPAVVTLTLAVGVRGMSAPKTHWSDGSRRSKHSAPST